MKIKTKIISIMVFISAIYVAAILGFIDNISIKMMKDQRVNSLNEINAHFQEKYEEMVRDAENLIENYSGEGIINMIINGNKSPEMIKNGRKVLSYILKVNKDVANAYLLDSEGRIIIAANENSPDYSGENSMHKLESGRIFYNVRHKVSESGSVVFCVDITSLIDDFSKKENKEIRHFIYDRKYGTFISNYEDEKELKKENILSKFADSKIKLLEIKENGDVKLIVLERGGNMVFGTFISKTHAYSDIEKLYLYAIGVLILLTAGIGVIAYLFTDVFVKQINMLLDASKKIAERKYVQLKFKATDEIKELGDNFNYMAREIKTFTENMEYLVNKRTNEMAELKEEMETIIDGVPAMIAYLSKDGRIIYCNKNFASWFAMDKKEMVGVYLSQIIEVFANSMIDGYNERVFKGDVVNFELNINDKGGNLHHLYFTHVPSLAETGTVKGYFALINDISELKNTEEKLRKSFDDQKFLNDILQKTNNASTANEILVLLHEVGARIGVTRAYIYMDHAGIVAEWRSQYAETLYLKNDYMDTIPWKRYIINNAWKDYYDSEEIADSAKEVFNLTGMKSAVGFPMVMGAKEIGYICFEEYGEKIPMEKIYFMKTLAKIMANAVVRKQTEEELEKYATTDMLTGAYNRRMALVILDTQIKIVMRDKSNLTIVYIDADNLKLVNDKYGHHEGDVYIKTVTESINDSIRESDILCRLGGDEFLIIMPKCNGENATLVMMRIIDKIDSIGKLKRKVYPMGISYGMAEYTGLGNISVDDLISTADRKMYLNKSERKLSNEDY